MGKPKRGRGRNVKDTLRTLGRWFEDTVKVIERAPKLTEADGLLAGTLLCSRKHALGILVLLGERNKVPAQALLRVLLELYVKLEWCCGGRVRLPKDEVHRRFQQLDCSRVIEQIKLLRNLSGLTGADKKVVAELARAKNIRQKYKERRTKAAPNMAGMFKVLAENEELWRGLYPRMYQNFSVAVHSDMRLLRQLLTFE